MIFVRNLSKHYRTSKGRKTVFENVTFTLDTHDRLGVLGRNGAGKSTLIRMISGIVSPSSGEVERLMSTSWPLGFGGGFQGSLSGLDNIRFIARIYDKPFKQVLRFVEDFSELGENLLEPVRHYSSGMRARLAFGLSMAIDFDCYLIDEVIAVGDVRFQEKCTELLFGAKRNRAMILASHDVNVIRRYCTKALVMHNGHGKLFDDLDLALDIYANLPVQQPAANKLLA